MTYTHTIDTAQHQLIVTVTGSITLPDSLQAIRDLIDLPEFEPDFDVLMDVRKMSFAMTSRDARAIAMLLVSHKEKIKGRVAVVVSTPLHYGMVRLVGTVAGLHEFHNLRPFFDYHTAAQWLEAHHTPGQ
jgi:hypothetical protein